MAAATYNLLQGFPPAKHLLRTVPMFSAATHQFLADTTADTVRKRLGYTDEAGTAGFRAALSHFISSSSDFASASLSGPQPDEIFVVPGISYGLEFLCTHLGVARGSTIVVEDPTYFFALKLFEQQGLRIVGVGVDADGLCVDQLEALLQTQRVALCYVISAHQNPFGCTLSHERRQRLVDLSHRHSFSVLSDEAYQYLTYDGPPPPPPLASYDCDTQHPASVFSLGSFSKLLSPGLRVGWIQTRKSLVADFAALGAIMSGGGLCGYTGALVESMLTSGALAAHLAVISRDFGQQADVLHTALSRRFPQDDPQTALLFRRPLGGYFLWIRLNPAGPLSAVPLSDLLLVFETHGVKVLSGSVCTVSRESSSHRAFRLCFAQLEPEQLECAVDAMWRSILDICAHTEAVKETEQ
eukprot:gnl/Spiro4/9688_TR5147_c0_g1_i1.p1 gnl/Spiro4/9688_TR5147_c0_g1~~gnl/Spiro4/9688_TR5147_c0_g1_i1.p1  ORF type:complete len:438 (+),score=133.10 gnl/Spiro4/9688_TR5147_c0_g1_i1:81-1316(+)